MKIQKRLVFLLLLLMAISVFSGEASAENAERLPDETLMAYYDRSIFAGDSVICLFRNYVKEIRNSDAGYFSGVKFYCAYSYQLQTASMEYVNANSDRVHLTYKGSKATLAEIMKKEKPAKVFIHAGLNEYIHKHLDRADSYINKILALRDKYSPDTKIYFLSLTPVTKKSGTRARSSTTNTTCGFPRNARRWGRFSSISPPSRARMASCPRPFPGTTNFT